MNDSKKELRKGVHIVEKLVKKGYISEEKLQLPSRTSTKRLREPSKKSSSRYSLLDTMLHYPVNLTSVTSQYVKGATNKFTTFLPQPLSVMAPEGYK